MKTKPNNFNGLKRQGTRSNVTTRTVLALLAAGILSMSATAEPAAGSAYSLRVITYLGDPAPGGGTFTNRLKPTALNNRGELAFKAEPNTPDKQGIFVADNDSLTQIVGFGETAPGGGVFGDEASGDIALNDPGDLAFGFQLEDGESVFRWSHQHQTLSALVIPNVTPVPDGSGVFVGAYGYPGINNQSDIAFLGNVTNPPPTSFTFIKQRTGVFLSDRFGNIATIAKPGNPAPGGGTFISAGAMYGSLFGFLFTIFTSGVDINDRGDVAFPAQVSTAPNNFTAYVRRFATGIIEPVPPPSGVVTGFVDRVYINNPGDVAFLAGRDLGSYLFGGVGAVCLSHQGTTVTVAALQNVAPEGGKFTRFGYGLGLNNRGDLAFAAQTDAKDRAMYLYSSVDKTLRRIAGIGTAVPAQGVITDLIELDFTELDMALNDRGQIAFVATITDGTTTRRAIVMATPGNEVN